MILDEKLNLSIIHFFFWGGGRGKQTTLGEHDDYLANKYVDNI